MSKEPGITKKVGTFDILKEMTTRNMDIRLSTLDNVTNLEYKKGNSFVRIGCSGDVVNGIANNEFIGGLLLANVEQWNQIKAELEAKTEPETASLVSRVTELEKALREYEEACLKLTDWQLVDNQPIMSAIVNGRELLAKRAMEGK